MKFQFKSFLILLILSLYQCASLLKSSSKKISNEEKFFWANEERSYEIYEPTKKKQYIFIGLHGRNGTGKEFLYKTKFFELAEKENIVLIFPNGKNNSWVDGRNLPTDNNSLDDSGFVLELAKKFSKIYEIEPKNIFLFGYSNGGYMVEKISFENNYFKSYATIVSTISKNLSMQIPKYAQNILLINGTEDPIVPFKGGEVLGGKGKILSVKDSINIWQKKNQCSNPEIFINPDKFDDGVKVKIHDYKTCKTNKKLKFIELIGGGHGWPGKLEPESGKSFGRFTEEINANEEIFNFFMETTKQ